MPLHHSFFSFFSTVWVFQHFKFKQNKFKNLLIDRSPPPYRGVSLPAWSRAPLKKFPSVLIRAGVNQSEKSCTTVEPGPTATCMCSETMAQSREWGFPFGFSLLNAKNYRPPTENNWTLCQQTSVVIYSPPAKVISITKKCTNPWYVSSDF
jgi:hypothetical protein